MRRRIFSAEYEKRRQKYREMRLAFALLVSRNTLTVHHIFQGMKISYFGIAIPAVLDKRSMGQLIRILGRACGKIITTGWALLND
ncbi:hypothetical protein [Methylobacterium radiodurans]|uniref:hypothetical protein n=1 Tax=Methylobacterium radiodurans TaxID=2202828 RepID=UPI0013A5A33E|nr:hypothetical protein [Methylobacterium radiodurans]